MNHQIMMVYLAIGIIYISVHLRITPQAKLNKIMQELREVFNEAPDTWHPILSLFTSIIFIFILACGVIAWPYYATRRIIKVVSK